MSESGARFGFVLAIVVLLTSAVLALRPAALRSPTTRAGFSAGRATEHLAAFATSPRPMGSRAHAAAAAYLQSAFEAEGLLVARERATVSIADEGSIVAGAVDDVVATLPGIVPDAGAVVVMAHYDSISTGPGVGDDGAAVAAMLEVARVLRAGPPLRRSVVFVASDGEEAGLLGARAFVRRHGAQVDTLLNFDGRGNAGMVLLFELRGMGAAALRALAREVPSVYATSVSGEVYRRMANDSDFSAFPRSVGQRALNFGHIGGAMRYHTSLDDVAHLDARTLQQQGDVMLGAARLFAAGAASPRETPGGSIAAITFTLPVVGVVAYSSRAALPLGLASLTVALLAAVVLARRGGLRPSRVALVMASVPLSLGVAGGAAWLAWRGMVLAFPSYEALPQEDVYGHDACAVGLVALAAAVALRALDAWAHVTTRRERDVGTLLVSAALATGMALVAPGVSYLFHVPVLLSSLGTCALACTQVEDGRANRGFAVPLAVRIACATAPVLLFVPIVHLTGLSMGFAHPALLGALAAYPVVQVAVHAVALGARVRRFAWALALCAAALLGIGARASRFDDDHPYPTTVVYLEADGGASARWISGLREGAQEEASLDPRESSLTSPVTDAEALLDVMPAAADVRLREGPAAPRYLAAATSEVTSDTRDGDDRVLTLRVRSARSAHLVTLHVASDAGVLAIDLPDRRFTALDLAAASCDPRDVPIAFWAPPTDGLELTIRVPAAGHLRLRTSDALFGTVAPDAGSPRRRVPTMAMPYGYGLAEATVTTTTRTP